MHKLAENHNIRSLQKFVCFSGKVEMMEKINGQTAKNGAALFLTPQAMYNQF